MLRPGLQRAIQIVGLFCRLYVRKQKAMNDYIDTLTDYTTDQRNGAKAALAAVMLACEALEAFRTIYES